MNQVIEFYHVLGNRIELLFAEKSIDFEYAKAWAAHNSAADQVFFVHKIDYGSKKLEVSIFNKDGSLARQCLHGSLALAQALHFADQSGEWHLYAGAETPNTLWVQKDVSVSCKIAQDFRIFDQKETCGIVQLGNLHWLGLVSEDPLLWKNLDSHVSLIKTRQAIPEHANISFVFDDVVSGKISLRTFEHGAGDTFSCGSAAVAAAFLIKQLKNHEGIVCIRQLLGESWVELEGFHAKLYAKPERLWHGSLDLDLALGLIRHFIS